MRYARHPVADDDSVHVVPETQLTDATAPRLTVGDRLRRTGGRFRELRGILRDDDHDIARGRTQQAEAQQDQSDRSE